LECGGKRSATPLLVGRFCFSKRFPSCESAVAAALCRRSPRSAPTNHYPTDNPTILNKPHCMNTVSCLEMRGVRQSFGATKALRGVVLTAVSAAFWSAVASAARHRFWSGAFAFQNASRRAKAPSSLRFAGAVQDRLLPITIRPVTRPFSINRTA